jgi:hypothetical protein
MNQQFDLGGPMDKNNSVRGYVPSLTGRWMRLVLGFSVSVGVGLAPYLGKLKVPLFTPMLSLIPQSLQAVALPLSAASMGLVAVLVQWYGSQQIRQKQLSTWFGRSAVSRPCSCLRQSK